MFSTKTLISISTHYPRTIISLITALSLVIAVLASIPSVWPEYLTGLNAVKVDTDPENMLSKHEPVRIFHDRMKKEMSLYDMIVVGIINNTHPNGVFNPSSLQKAYKLTEFAKTLQWPDPENPDKYIGVVKSEILAPSTVDNIEQDSPGSIKFEWLMPRPPKSDSEAQAIRAKAARIPLLNGTLVSENGKALCIYLPITSKDLSHKIYVQLKEKIKSFTGNEEYHITGLPVAEDTFGVEMFIQMAISAPMAMLVIFLIMLYFFKKLLLIISPLLIAIISTICTMGLLIITGNTIHIMSSMIPIFIMPIAVLDSVHILSEFFDRYQAHGDKKSTIVSVMDHLFTPMLYTSLTTAVGFASLALTPIPPVQIFGVFIAFGVMTAWLFTITFIPAFIMLIPEKSLKNFGLTPHTDNNKKTALEKTGDLIFRNYFKIISISICIIALSIYGITLININDNPIKWFKKNHPIRYADRILNQNFGGTYMAYLELEKKDAPVNLQNFTRNLQSRLESNQEERNGLIDHLDTVYIPLIKKAGALSHISNTPEELINKLNDYCRQQTERSEPALQQAWQEAVLFMDKERQKFETFKQPDVLKYIDNLQKYLSAQESVGKSNSISDIVKTVYRELISGKQSDYIIPKTAAAVGQCLITYQNSHRPNDIWHFVTPDFKKTVIWLQLTSGDNKDMSKVVTSVNNYLTNTPPPIPLNQNWFGLTYINTVWQDKMVKGMLEAFLGSFIIVFLMMTLLYRSALWGVLSMIPLTITIALIYGITGLIGKDYDMPIAVLSSLSLGLAIDYAIHFLSRTRAVYSEQKSWKLSVPVLFGEPARAILRNVVVIGVGFLPLLFAPLIPYRTVGIFIAAILITSGIATLLILPALITLFRKLLFPQTPALALTCRFGTCLVTVIALVGLLLINFARFTRLGWSSLSIISAAVILVMAALCFFLSKRGSCKQ